MSQTIDVARLAPEARPIAVRVADIYLRHLGDDFVGLIAHGSGVKGDFILHVSDLDFQLYLRPDFGDAHGPMPLETATAIQRELATIDPAPFAYIQGYAHGDAIRPGWVGPVPGAYVVLAGKLPIPEATAAELTAAAIRDLAAIPERLASLPQGLLDTGSGRLAHRVRLLLTDVWSALKQVVALQTGEPIAAWHMTQEEAIEALRSAALRRTASAVYEAARALSRQIDSLEAQPAVVRTGAAFLAAADAWAADHAPPR